MKMLCALVPFTVLLIGIPSGMPYKMSGSKIVGGIPTSIEKHPYMAALKIPRIQLGPFCAGTIIAQKTVLTAAHCLSGNVSRERIVVTVGETYTIGGSLIHQVAWMKVHEKYSEVFLDNDIGLVGVAEPFLYSNVVQPIQISTELLIPPGIEATVIGWGTRVQLQADESSPTEEFISTFALNELITPIISNDECMNYYKWASDFRLSETQMCTLDEAKAACFGDSGGPLVIGIEQVAIVSYGVGCGIGYPVVYTRVASYVDWIVTNDANYF